jgi:hypothetical protein
MSHIDSVTPPGPLTLAPGASRDLDVLVSGVPGDDTATLRFEASDGSVVTTTVTIDRAALEGAVNSGSPAANQVFAALVGAGTLVSAGAITGGWRFRYTAA